MRSVLRRELGAGAALAVTLASGLVVSRWGQALVLAGFVMLWLVARTWRRLAHERLRPRLASTITVGWFSAGVVLIASGEVGAPVVVLVMAVVAAEAAARDRVRLRGAALPAQGEARGRRSFQGTAHALGEPSIVPGAERTAVLWVARQGRRRWTSTGRVELRGEQRKVWLEPARARARPQDATWVMKGATGRNAAKELEGSDEEEPIHMWILHEGDDAYVVGGAVLEDDPAAQTYRDPGRVSVFTGDLMVGKGQRAGTLRHAHGRLLMWVALASSAVTLALLR